MNIVEFTESLLISSGKNGFLAKHKSLRQKGKILYLRLLQKINQWYLQAHLLSPNKIQLLFSKYKIKKYAVYVDRTTSYLNIPRIQETKVIGYYSSDLKLIGKKINGCDVEPISDHSEIPSCDGWLVASFNRTASYALSQILLKRNVAHQVIIRLSRGKLVHYYSYADFFSGKTRTLIHIHNYFQRLYDLSFPINLRYSLCNTEGNVVLSGQWILAPNATLVIDSQSFNLGEFRGYIEIEFDLESFKTHISPFLHYWIDYLSENAIACNHQSGFGVFGTDVCFTRGYFVNHSKTQLVASLFNFNHKSPIKPLAVLEYTKNGKRESVEKLLNPIPYRHMTFQNISELFKNELSEQISSIVLFVKSEKSMHRPNYYHFDLKGNCFFDTYHATGETYRQEKSGNPFRPQVSHSKVFEQQELARLYSANCYPWRLDFPILDSEEKINSILINQGESKYPIKKFIFTFYASEGKKIFEKKEIFDFEKENLLNLNQYLKENQIAGAKLFSLFPDANLADVPYDIALTGGFEHLNNPYLTTTSVGSAYHNVPFYIKGNLPKSFDHTDCAAAFTNLFARGIYANEFDSLFILIHSSCEKNYDKVCKLEIEIYNQEGDSWKCYEHLKPSCVGFFWLSDLIAKQNIMQMGSFYTVWFRSNNAFLNGFHLLKRLKDESISIEHMYVGKKYKMASGLMN